jgi:hypothetical protein
MTKTINIKWNYMMTGETETIFHSEDKDVFNSPLAVSIKYDGINRPTQPLPCLGVWGQLQQNLVRTQVTWNSIHKTLNVLVYVQFYIIHTHTHKSSTCILVHLYTLQSNTHLSRYCCWRSRQLLLNLYTKRCSTLHFLLRATMAFHSKTYKPY